MKWISVKDRLPDNEEMVLVWNKDDVEFGRYSKENGWVDYTSHLRNVTHWMPKPNNPNKEEKENVTIVLTRVQAEKLDDILCFHQDEGPPGEGWASEGLKKIRQIIEDSANWNG